MSDEQRFRSCLKILFMRRRRGEKVAGRETSGRKAAGNLPRRKVRPDVLGASSMRGSLSSRIPDIARLATFFDAPPARDRGVLKRLLKATSRYTHLNLRIAALCLMIVFAGACNAPRTPQDSGAVRDDASRTPQRIISLTPSATEMLYGVGAFGRVVAVSDYCDYPPEVAALPRVGGWQNTNIERLAALRPDLVVMMDAQSPFIKDRLDALNIRTLTVGTRTLDDTFAAIEAIGRATGQSIQAGQLSSETRAALEAVRAQTAGRARPRVLCVVDRVPGTLRDLYAATRGSFLAELIEIAGGDVIAPDAASGYGQISKEALLTLDPEIIIDIVQSTEGSFSEDSESVWRELPRVRAVRDGRVYTVRDARVVHPSQLVVGTARRFAGIIHPEVFRRDEGSENRRPQE